MSTLDRLPATAREPRVRLPKRPKLPRSLGAAALFSACYGNVGSSIYYALGVTAAVALGLTPLAFLLAGGIFVTTALNYAEGTAAIPHAGGSSSFARRAFSQPIGYLVGWVQLLNYTATVSISAYAAIAYLGIFGQYVTFFKLLNEPHNHAFAAVALTGALIIINVIGIQESSVMNLVLALLDLGTQLVLVLLGIFLLLNFSTVIHNIRWGVAPTWGNFLASVSIAMVSYTGIETISNMAEEARNPGRAVPRATFGVIAAVLFVSAFLPTIGMSVFPVHPDPGGAFSTDLATRWMDDPVAGIVTFFRPEALAFWAGVWVALLAFTILVIATNAGLIGISRLSYSMATHKVFPRVFASLHPRYRTPYVSIIVFGIAAALLILPAQINLMAAVYSLAATFAFATAHLAVMRLRYVEPDLYRPYTMPFNIRFGRSSVPLLSLVGALAIGSVFTELLAQNISSSTYLYAGWLILGVAVFAIYRRLTRQPLWEPIQVPPRPDREIAHGRVPLPRSAHFHVDDGETTAAAPARLEEPEGHRAHLLNLQLIFLRSNLRGVLAIFVFAGLSLLAILADLSPYDPFGTRLGWSVGVIIVAFFSALLLIRSRQEL